MLDLDADLPYVVWYQCKSCTHLFYNDKAKIVAHLSDKHGLLDPTALNLAPSSLRSVPLKIKEQHFRPVLPSTSSGFNDGEFEDNYNDIINNNTSISSSNSRNKYKLCKPESPMDVRSKCAGGSTPTNSFEVLRKQLLKSDIDISEIKIDGSNATNDGHMVEEHIENMEDEDTEELTEGDVEGSSSQNYECSESCEDAENEENSEDQEEGASISNQSFYDDSDIGGHFLINADNESESALEDDGIITPNFGIVDELYRRVSEAAAMQVPTSSIRKRTNFNPCKLCKRNFPSLSMLKKHAKTHLNEEGGSQHICKFCFEYFPSAAGLSKHLKVHSEENPNVCNICSKSFTSWATLRTHLKIHSGERPFGCDHCGQRFQTKSTLDSHLRIHTGSRPHICPICSKSFRTSSPLYRHMRSVHKGLSLSSADS